MAKLRIRELEQYLQDIETFEKPKILLEQYATSAHIGAHMLYTIQSQYEEIEHCKIADLGTGCGTLAFGAAMLGAGYVVGFEIDSDAIDTLRNNSDELELPLEVVQCDILKYLPGNFEKKFDTVIMNPPFGTKRNAGMDVQFLEIATKLATKSVYSLHKTSTRDYVLKKARSLGTKGEVIAELRYDLPRAYKFHKKESVDIAVDFIRFEILA